MATNSLVGSASFPERTHPQSLAFKALAKRIASTLRCGLPGIILEFNPTTQYATVQLAITEELVKATGGTEATAIPPLHDVLVLFPGDAQWCITFPSLVNSECYVCFADMCVNAWATHGWKGTDAQGNAVPQDQELQRRHDLSDGFAILAPRSKPNIIPNYSTSAVELRSMDSKTKISLDSSGHIILTSGQGLTLSGLIASVYSGTTPSTASFPVFLNGVTYFIRLSTTP